MPHPCQTLLFPKPGAPGSPGEPGRFSSTPGSKHRPRRTPGKVVIVGPDGKAMVVEGTGDDAFDLLLNDSKVPETTKEQIRKSRDSLHKVIPAPEPKKEE